jgi:hypothetical protein
MSLEDWANVSTIVLAAATVVLAIGAIIAAIYAKNNVNVLKKRDRYDVISSLLKQMNSREARNNKAIIHRTWQSKGWNSKDSSIVGKEIDKLVSGVWEAEAKGTDVNSEDRNIKDAIEETVALLDTIGHFLLENEDSKILEETPVQFWSVGSDMWNKFRTYINIRRSRGEVWGTYFERLGNEAPNYYPPAKVNNND